MKTNSLHLSGRFLALVLLFCSLFAFVSSGLAAPKKLLVVTVTKGFRHSSIPTAEKVLGDWPRKAALTLWITCGMTKIWLKK